MLLPQQMAAKQIALFITDIKGRKFSQATKFIEEEFWPTLLSNVASVHWFMHSCLQVQPQHFNQVEVWTLTGPLQRLDSFLFQTFWCIFAAVFRIIVLLMTKFQPSFGL